MSGEEGLLSDHIRFAHLADLQPVTPNRAIGLHASISTQLCAHSLDQKTGEWRPNLQCFIDRIASHPERLQYMYFNTVILLRAISRAGPYLAAYDLSTGAGQEETTTLTTQLLNQVIAVADSVGQFDETSLFRGEDAKVGV